MSMCDRYWWDQNLRCRSRIHIFCLQYSIVIVTGINSNRIIEAERKNICVLGHHPKTIAYSVKMQLRKSAGNPSYIIDSILVPKIKNVTQGVHAFKRVSG